MKKTKKLLALTMCTILVATTALAGCGKSGGGSGEGSAPTKLTWYAIGDEPKDLDKVMEAANEYLEEKVNAHIDMRYIGFGDYDQKMSVVINSGEDYDIAFTCSWAGDYLGNSRKGAFLALDDYIESDEGALLKETIDDRFWEGAEIDGSVFAVPGQKELGVAPMWVFTKEYVDKYDIPYQDLHDLEDLEPWLELIKENEPDVVPLYITDGFSYTVFFDQLVDPVGVESNDDSLTIQNMFETEEMKQKLQTLRRYYEKGYINADAATAQDDDSVKRLVTKGDGQPYADTLWSKGLGYEVVSSYIVDTLITNGSTTGSMMAISSNSKNKDKAFEVLSLLNTDPEFRNLINYGIEDVHYEKVGEENIKIINPDDKAYDVPYFALGNLFITYKLEDEPATKWDEFQDFNDKAQVSPALGFKFDSSSVSNEIAAINNVLEEYKSTLYSGSVDVDEYLDKLNEKLHEQGIQKVIDEMQSQIDEWKAQ